MSPVAMTTSTNTHFEPFVEALRTAPTAPGGSRGRFEYPTPLTLHTDAKAAADRLAREIAKEGYESLT